MNLPRSFSRTQPLAKLREAGSSLRTRNYRLFFTGQLVSQIGTWVQTVAQSFLILDLTGSGTALGLVLAVRYLPLFLFGLWGGVTADRLNKRRVLYVTQALSALIAAAFGTLVATHEIRMWMVYLLALALGFVNVFDNPARQAFITELVPVEQMSNAVTLNSVLANVARVLGAAVGGVVSASIGLALCFDLNAASFLAVIIMLARLSAKDMLTPKPDPRAAGQIRDGLRHVVKTPELLIPLLMIFVVGTLAWEFEVSLPVLARNTFHGGPSTYSLMTVVMGAGAVVGGLVAASRSRIGMRPLSRAAIGWGFAITAAALMPSLVSDLVALAFVGYGSITFNSLGKTTLQMHAGPLMRGRVMSLWALAWMGSTPIGGPIIGWLSAHFNARVGLLAGGLPTLAVGLIVLPYTRRLDRRQSAEVDAALPVMDPASPDMGPALPAIEPAV
jgi:MFS family permease